MNRFVAMLWDHGSRGSVRRAADLRQSLESSATDWQLVLDRPGFLVYLRRRLSEAIGNAALDKLDGLVVGSLFKRGHENEGPLSRLPEADAQQLAASSGKWALDACWGSYVAIWRAPNTPRFEMLRDPCGGQSCYHVQNQGVQMLCAYPLDIASLPGLTFSIDWDFLRAFLLSSSFTTRHTGLRELKELLPGQRMTWTPGSDPTTTWSWRAPQHAAHKSPASFNDAAEELRETANACFAAYGRAHRRLIVRLSGGLDSSVVTGLFRRSGAVEMKAVHLVARDYESHERELARLVARHVGIELVEIPIEEADASTADVLQSPQLARPTTHIFGQAISGLTADLCQSYGARALAAGHGGDAMFLQRSLATDTLTDHVHAYGFGHDFLGAAYDAARLQEKSVWSVLGRLRRSLRSKPDPLQVAGSLLVGKNSLLTPEAAGSIPNDYKWHPWLAESGGMPPGKVRQVAALLALYGYHSPHAPDADFDMLAPLFSQPLLELVLRTPTYVLTRGGMDRSLERTAFADLLPPAVVRRTAKGFVSHQLLTRLSKRPDELRTLLLDGELTRLGWLSRPDLERAASQAALSQGRALPLILNLVAVESWLRAWRSAAR